MESSGRQSAGKLVPWLAGMVDADGSIGLHRQPLRSKVTYVPSVSLVTSCAKTKRFVDVLFADLEVGRHITERTPQKAHWSTVWVFEIRGMKRVDKLLRIIRPHLVTKADEADTVLAFIEHRLGEAKNVPYGAFEEQCRTRLKECKNRNGS